MTNPDGIGATARSGARSTFVAQVVVQLGSVVATMVLARILSPSEFGAIALVQSVLGVSALLNLAGLNAALVSRRGDVERAAASYLWLTVSLGLVLYVSLFFGSYPLMQSMGQPESAFYLQVLSLSVPLTLLTMVPQAILQRRLAFKALNTASVISAIFYFAAEIGLALAGWGVWAVILGQVSSAALLLLLTVALARWIPKHGFHWSDIRLDLAMLGGLSLSRLFEYVYKNVDYWIASRSLGPSSLGIYYVAYVLPNIVRLRLSGVFRTVMLPVVSQNPSQDEARRHWIRATTVLLSMGIPALAGIAAISGPLVRVFFGATWEEAVLPMQILTLGTVADLLIQAVGTMALAQRQVGRHTLVLAIRAVATFAFVLIAVNLQQSLWSVALAVAVAGLVTLVVQEVFVSRPLGVGLHTMKRPIFTTVLLSAVMLTAVTAILMSLPAAVPAIAELIIGVAVGVLVYVGVGLIAARTLINDVLVQSRRMLLGR